MANTMATSIQRLLRRTDRMKQRAVKGLLRTLKQIDKERKRRTADLEEAAKLIGRQLAELGHRITGTKTITRKSPVSTAKRATKAARKRIRRTPQQLKAEAAKALALIKKSRKDGIGGKALRKAFPEVGQNIKGFLEKHGGEKVKTTGQRSAMRYFAM